MTTSTQLGYDVERATVVPRLSRAPSSADQQFLVAELDGRVVGWVHVAIWEFLETERFGLIAGLVVDKSRRKRGIGRLLMDHAEEWSAKQGCSLVRLWSSSRRTEAHRFYEHLGYTNVKTQYSFAKCLDATYQDALRSLVPYIDQ